MRIYKIRDDYIIKKFNYVYCVINHEKCFTICFSNTVIDIASGTLNNRCSKENSRLTPGFLFETFLFETHGLEISLINTQTQFKIFAANGYSD